MKCINIALLLSVIALCALVEAEPDVEQIPTPLLRIGNKWKCAKTVMEATRIIAKDILPVLPEIVECAGFGPSNQSKITSVYDFLKEVLVKKPQCISEKVQKTMEELEKLIKFIEKNKC